MRRREFLCVLGCEIAVTWPRAVRAQQTGKVYRIAIVRPSGPVSEINETDAQYGPFLGELRRLGYIEGQNLGIERVSAGGRFEQYAEVVSAVVRSNPDAVFAFSAQLTIEFKAQTKTIPIVGGAADPVAEGIVTSLARPGSNITGIAGGAGLEPWDKRVGLLKEVIPTLSRVGILIANTLQGQHGAAVVKEAAAKLGVLLVGSLLESPFNETTYRRAFEAIVHERAEAIYIGEQHENWTNRQLIREFAKEYKLPAISPNDEDVKSGGLMAYTADWPEVMRQAAHQVDRIFKGHEAQRYPLVPVEHVPPHGQSENSQGARP